MKAPEKIKDAVYKMKLPEWSGKVIFFREAKMRDHRMSAARATQGGRFIPHVYIEEMVKLMMVAAYRRNGEEIDIKDRDLMMDNAFTFKEATKILSKTNEIGLGMEDEDDDDDKKKVIVEKI